MKETCPSFSVLALITAGALVLLTACRSVQETRAKHRIAPGPFQPIWQSLAQNYRCPDWFRGMLYAFLLGWPEGGKLVIHSLGRGTPEKPAPLNKAIMSLSLLGSKEKIAWTQDANDLRVTLTATKPCDDVFCLKLALE